MQLDRTLCLDPAREFSPAACLASFWHTPCLGSFHGGYVEQVMVEADVSEAGSKHLSICVLNDPDHVDLITQRLISAGFSVVGSVSPDDALRKIRLAGCRVLLVDFEMPGMNGLTSASEVRSPLSLDQVRSDHIERVLAMCNGNRVRAAKMLGIGRTSLYRFLKRGKAQSAGTAS